MKGTMLTIWILALGLVLCSANVSEAAPMGTAFTYQGFLYDANSPADDIYDFEFTLYDANDAGSLVAGPVAKGEVDVYAGVFTTEIDFGSDVFDGNDVWLQIGVRPGPWDDPNIYTTLSPRQQLTPTPYAIYAQTAGGIPGGISGSGTTNYIAKFTAPNALGDSAIYEEAGNIGIGTTSPAQKLHVAGSMVVSGTVNGRDVSADGTKLDGVEAGADVTSAANVAAAGAAMDSDFTSEGLMKRGATGGSYSIVPDNSSNWNTAFSWGDHTAAGYLSTLAGHSVSELDDARKTGSESIFIGDDAGKLNTGVRNSGFGYRALYTNGAGHSNVAMGAYAAGYNKTGSENTAVGKSALMWNDSGGKNSAVGYGALYANTTGNQNTALGYDALENNSTGGNNTAIGCQALESNTTAWGNTGVGCYAGASNSAGTGNTFIGHSAGVSTTGSKNVFLGYEAGYNESGSDRLYIANSRTDPPLIYGQFNTGRIGIGTTSPSYPLEMGSGAHCTVGGVWTDASSAELKENFTEVNPAEVLGKVRQLSITRWNYKAEDTSVQHIGPVAEDFHSSFGLGDSDKAISGVDRSGVALAAIQGLCQLVEEKDAEIVQLKERVSKMEAMLDKLVSNPEGGIR